MRRYHHGDESSSSDSDMGTTRIVRHVEFDEGLHAFLCGKSAVGPDHFLGVRVTPVDPRVTPVDPDAWHTVPRRSNKGHHGQNKNDKIRVKGEQSAEWVEKLSKFFRDYFYGLYGRQIPQFQLTQSSHKYVSMLPSARSRDRVLATLFQRRPVIWDLMAGSGADVIAFLLNLDPYEIVACQRSTVPDDQSSEQYQESLKEFFVMQDNIMSVANAFPELNVKIRSDERRNLAAPMLSAGATRDGVRYTIPVKCKHKHAQTFIGSVARGTEVDLVYLDPSWDDDYATERTIGMREYELSPEELFKRLQKIIWGPIEERGIKVGCYVIKTRWDWLKVQSYLPSINSKFIATYSIKAQQLSQHPGKPGPYGQQKGIFHYMILVHRDYQTITAETDQMYWDIVRNGQPIWVKKDTFAKVIKPVYSDYLHLPEFKEKEPVNGSEYIYIMPPPAEPGPRTVAKKPAEPTYDPRSKDHETDPAAPEETEQSDEDWAYENPFGVLKPQEAASLHARTRTKVA
jgi:hypothetical protein